MACFCHGIKASEESTLQAGRRKKMACQPHNLLLIKKKIKRRKKVSAVRKIHLLC